MAEALGPIYVVVRTSKVIKEREDFHIYTKRSSNKKAMIAYAKEIQARYPYAVVLLMTREKAEEQNKAFCLWRKEQERLKLEKCDRNLNKLLTRTVYADSIKRVAQR